jgi:hypothetical protein
VLLMPNLNEQVFEPRHSLLNSSSNSDLSVTKFERIVDVNSVTLCFAPLSPKLDVQQTGLLATFSTAC